MHALRKTAPLLGLATLAALGLAAPPAHAQGYTLKTLSDFYNAGSRPNSLTLSADGTTLYGTTAYGGNLGVSNGNGGGTVFSASVNSVGVPVTTLATFGGANGANPFGNLILSGTTLYGSTYGGGANNDGTVFSLPTSGGTPMVLASFNGANGGGPGALAFDGATFYGSTFGGGGPGATGTVFSVPIGGGAITTLGTFTGITGSGPNAGVILSRDSRTVYGTIPTGGVNGAGEVYSVPIGGGTPTTLASFNGYSAGAPHGVTLSADGTTLYGSAFSGGTYGKGAVYSVPVGGGTPTVLASFNGSNGAAPYAGLTLSADGTTLYGTTDQGGANSDGEVFSLPVSGGTPTVLFSFNGTNGSAPDAPLTLGSNGILYGTTARVFGGGFGTVFALVPTPEPTSPAVLGIGLLGLAGLGLRARQRFSAGAKRRAA